MSFPQLFPLRLGGGRDQATDAELDAEVVLLGESLVEGGHRELRLPFERELVGASTVTVLGDEPRLGESLLAATDLTSTSFHA